MQIKIENMLNVQLLDKMLNDFYKIIKLPIAIVDISGEIVVCAGWTSMCSDIQCNYKEYNPMCLNEYLKNNSNCIQCNRDISCLNGLKLYRIPVYIKGSVVANIFLSKNKDYEMEGTSIETLIQFFDSFAITFSDILTEQYKNTALENKQIIDYEEMKTSYDQLVTINNGLRFNLWEIQNKTESRSNSKKHPISTLERKYLMDTVFAMGNMIEKKDTYTARHQKRVAYLACKIAVKLKLSKVRYEGLYVAAMLHDIGKIGIPSDILAKPAKLSDLEYELIKSHVQTAYDIISTIDFPWPVADIVLQHHEKINGTGYPHGLTGERILLEAKIISVADVVEAITAHRPYKPALSMAYALEEIKKFSGIYYEPKVVEACIRVCTESTWNDYEEEESRSIHFIS